MGEQIMNEKIKRFIDCYLPVTTCNFRCHYCYITQQHKFDATLPKFKYTAEQIGQALSQERLGGVCCFNICGGGETLLPPETLKIAEAILKQGHYVMIVTNGSLSHRFDEIIKISPHLLKRLLFKFSFHYLELKRMKILDKFFDNVTKVKQAGCSFSVEITPNDELIPEIENIKKICLEKIGALPHITVARNNTIPELPILTNLSPKDYEKVWAQFSSKLFEYKLSVFNKKRKEFCYAGDWTGYLHLGTGYLQQCYKGKILQNIFEEPQKPILFCAIGNNCKEAHCYNAHAWLCFGAIPELNTPAYSEMRDRVTSDKSHWLTPEYSKFLSTKLKESNQRYSCKKQKIINQINAPCHSCKKNAMFSVENTGRHKKINILGIKIKIKQG